MTVNCKNQHVSNFKFNYIYNPVIKTAHRFHSTSETEIRLVQNEM